MSKEFVERRVAQRAPLKTEVKIRFEDSDRVLVAQATDISAGGIQISVPWGRELFEVGQMIGLVFTLPVLGEIQVRAEIRHSFFGIDDNQNRLVFYGCRFVDITMETWNYIMDYCQVKLEMLQSSPKVKTERKDLRITANLAAQIKLEGGDSCLGMIEDISFGGVKTNTPLPIPVNCNLTIKITTKTEPLELPGTCVWSSPNPAHADEYFAGIFFARLDPERFNRLRSIIFELARAPGSTPKAP